MKEREPAPLQVAEKTKTQQFMEWKEFKQIIPQRSVVKIEPTDITLGKFNFNTGDVDRYNFKAEYVIRNEDVLWNSSLDVCGVITHDSGKSYRVKESLCYTDEESLEKLAEPMRKAKLSSRKELWDELCKY